MSNGARHPYGDDAELVGRARAGGTEAFGELVRRHGPVARQVAVRMLGDHGLAEDAVQEATLRAYLSLARLRCPARFGSWLCGITLNMARRCLRERRRVVLGGVLPEPQYAPDIAGAYEHAQLAATVRDAVTGLAAGQRDATLLFYWQGLTHAEAAAELGISVAAVKNRLHHARIALARPLAAAIDQEQHDQEEITAMSTPVAPRWVEVSVAEVRRGEAEDASLQPHVVLLRERDTDRTLPIWIGRAEATALALTLETVEMPRPMTYQMTADLLAAVHAPVHEVRITRLAEHTFYAVVVLNRTDDLVEVDSRPSDAINLAVLTGAPVLVDHQVLSDARATGRPEWRQYPTMGTELVREARQQHTKMTVRLEPC